MSDNIRLNTSTLIVISGLIVFLGGIFYATFILFKPFYKSIFLASIVAIAVHPLKKFLLKLVRGRKNLTAFIITVSIIGVIAGLLLPISLSLFRESKELYTKARDKITATDSEWMERAEKLRDSFLKHSSEKVYEFVLGFADKMKDFSHTLITWITSIMRGTFKFIFDTLMFLLFLFYFVRDGDEIVKSIIKYVPLDEKLKNIILENLYRTVFAVVMGVFLTAIVQGILAGIGFFIAGVRYPSLLGLLTSICSLLPVGGAALVWAPATIGLLLNKAIGKAIFMGIWGAFLVSTIDNIIKPLIIGKNVHLPFLWMFVFIIGGLKVFGFTGIFVGPIIYSLLRVAGETVREYSQLGRNTVKNKEEGD